MNFLNATNVLTNRVNCTETTFIQTLFLSVLRDLHALLTSCDVINHRSLLNFYPKPTSITHPVTL